jgi:hypothetical protein
MLPAVFADFAQNKFPRLRVAIAMSAEQSRHRDIEFFGKLMESFGHTGGLSQLSAAVARTAALNLDHLPERLEGILCPCRPWMTIVEADGP